jgi:sortase A
MELRRALGALGRALIATGVLLLLFVAYQLWGTGIHEARAQASLKDDFEETIAAAPAPAPTSSPGVAPAPPPDPIPGDAVALVRIPEIGIDKAVVEGVSVADLKKGPGHYPLTPLPGQPGNAAIAGHRTTYGAPFNRLDELSDGDEILVTTQQGEFRYLVETIQVVAPHQTEVLAQPDDPDATLLTLTTCHPEFSARERLVVTARLAPEEEPAAAPPARPRRGSSPTTPSAEEPPAFEEAAGLSGDRAAARPTVLWGLAAAAVALATWLLRRRTGRWAYAVGAPVFLVVLFVFYENVARLLPANI